MGEKKQEDLRVGITQTMPRPATALSVLGHAVFLALLAVEAPRHLTISPQQPAVVDVVMVAPSTSRPAPMAAPLATTPPEIESQAPSSPPPETARPSSNGRVTAREYFAGAVLDDPRNKETRQKLATLGSDERLIQICNIEAMEQLKRWKTGFVPDHVVSYATSDPVLTATSIEAVGAAVHSVGKWYRLSFSCTTTTSLERVASFTFKLGRPIPQEEWERDNLPELVDGDPTD